MLASRFNKSISTVGRRQASEFLAKFAASVKKLPMRESQRYIPKNTKFTASDMYRHVENHANALLDYEFAPGETLGIWMPDGAERHVSLMAAARIGLNVVEIDEQINDVKTLRNALWAGKINYLFYCPEVEDVSNHLMLLRRTIPEYFAYDDEEGQFFHSKHFPTIKSFFHTGFDLEQGSFNYKELFLPHPLSNYVKDGESAISDDTPFYTKITQGEGSNVVVSKAFTRGELLSHPDWKFIKDFIEHRYFEVK